MGKHYSELFESKGFVRGESCGVVFYHSQMDVAMAVHGDDFTFCGLEEDLIWIRDLMQSWFEINKEVAILGRIVK